MPEGAMPCAPEELRRLCGSETPPERERDQLGLPGLSIAELPTAVLAHILSFLPVMDIVSASLAARCLRAAADEPVLAAVWHEHIRTRRWGDEWDSYVNGIGRRALSALTDRGLVSTERSLRDARWFARARERHFRARGEQQRAREVELLESLYDDFDSHASLYWFQAHEPEVMGGALLSGE